MEYNVRNGWYNNKILCYEYLSEITSDIDAYITNKIEAEVNFLKV